MMAVHALQSRRRLADIRTIADCAPAFAARPLPDGVCLQPACAPYVPRHVQQRPPKGPIEEELRALPASLASILTGPEPEDAAVKTASIQDRQAPAPPERQASGAEATTAAGEETHSRPAKRVRRSAGPQPLPPLRLPHPAAARLLLQTACSPFDISLDTALQHLTPPAAPLARLHMPTAGHSLAVSAGGDGGIGGGVTGPSSSHENRQSQPQLLPPPPPLLPVFAHPASRAPTPQQAAVLRACSDADAGRASAARPLTPPAMLVGYQEDWLEIAPTALSMWDKAPLEPYSAPKAVLYYVLAAEAQRQEAEELLREVSGVYAACRLGSHAPAPGAVLTFSPAEAASIGDEAGDLGDAAAVAQQLPRADRVALRGICTAARRLQRRLLIDPPACRAPSVGLQEFRDVCVAVYALCPSRHPAVPAATHLAVAACLAPCLPEAAAAVSGAAGEAGTADEKRGSGSREQEAAATAPLTPPGVDVGAKAALAPSTPASTAGSPRAVERLAPAAAVAAVVGQHSSASMSATAASGHVHDATVVDTAPVQQLVDRDAPAAAEAAAELVARYHGAALQTHTVRCGVPAHANSGTAPAPPLAWQPLDISLQVVSQRALADITGAAVRALAFSMFSKVTRRQSAARPSGGSTSLQSMDGVATADLPEMLHEPAFILAPPQPPAPTASVQPPGLAQRGGAAAIAGGALSRRTLHCCYAGVPGNGRPAVLVATDASGELLRSQLLASSPAPAGRHLTGRSSGGPSECRRVLSAALDTWHSVCSGGGVAMDRLVIARLGAMPAAEQQAGTLSLPALVLAWRSVLHNFQLPSLPTAASVQLGEVAVVALHAHPPVRLQQPWDDLRSEAYAVSSWACTRPAGAAASSSDDTGSLCNGPWEALHMTVVWGPPQPPAAPLLPGEVDTVRLLHVTLHTARSLAAQGDSSGVANAAGAAASPAPVALCQQVAEQLFGLAQLSAAHARLAIAAPLAAGGMGLGWWGWASADAHLPLHAAAAQRAAALLAAADG